MWTSLFFLVALICFALIFWPMWRQRETRLVSIAITIFSASAAIGLYQWVGTPNYLVQIAAYNAETEHAQRTLARAKETLQQQPQDPAAHVDAARALIELGQPQEALPFLRRAAVITQGAPEILLMLGKAEIIANEGQVNQAARDAFRVILLQVPNAQEPRYFQALDKQQQGQTQEALKLFQALIAEKNLPNHLHEAVAEQIKTLQNKN